MKALGAVPLVALIEDMPTLRSSPARSLGKILEVSGNTDLRKPCFRSGNSRPETAPIPALCKSLAAVMLTVPEDGR